MIPLGPVVARSKARAARAAVWQYLIDDERRKVWWPELRLDPRVGGAVSERWAETSGDSEVSRDASGEVDVLVEGHAIGFRWSEAGDEHSTAVLVTLRSTGPNTGITVTETGFDALSSPAESAAASQEGWHVLLGDLVEAVEAAVASGAFAEETEAVTEAAVAEPDEAPQPDAEPAAVAEQDTEAAELADAEQAEAEQTDTAQADAAPEESDEPAQDAEQSVEDQAPVEDAQPVEAVVEPDEIGADEDGGAEANTNDDDPEEPNFDDLIRGPQSS
ncbi:hypothetical protein G7068_12750 [Leucobacter viscericola]|uniref:Activator of Hsp90 ATPase homologue 1/2-like C-terminal domain-containing protein n=1 Tax=Leucobacter viscericola TaxID=2714935 RepID=A0A6G7XHW1_9MICO|nr:SRPBCC domain-containing protein [Leucobacter viscericola]QIK63967.1 hypothetical protein G7068_12750 [Leucobacter viscericola]